ncbi:MAG TPA: DUF4347 domain-containing protein [Polyangia bacterium]|jgi:hypothetical protein|nr:DUF4347 domain-containing protein [Polyangia bacterium]
MNAPEKTGWSHQVEFSDLQDLLQKLNALRPSIKGQITKLGIVAHGDEGGVVEIGPKLTVNTAAGSAIDLQQLDSFLVSYARVIFFSCIAGDGERGTTFLNLLSGRFFLHRHIIGFDVFALYATVGANAPGAMDAADKNKFAMPAGPRGRDPRLTEYSWYAKWSLDGRVIKKSANDQGALTHTSHTVSGIKAVETMIKANLPTATIVSVAIQNDALRSRIAGLSNPLVAGKVKIMSAAELTKLAGTPHHQGVVGVWDKPLTLQKCADPRCPGHASAADFCEAFVNQFPNGPLR